MFKIKYYSSSKRIVLFLRIRIKVLQPLWNSIYLIYVANVTFESVLPQVAAPLRVTAT
jgi:hypothetical protein